MQRKFLIGAVGGATAVTAGRDQVDHLVGQVQHGGGGRSQGPGEQHRPGAVQLVVCLVLGALAMFAAIGASSPLLRKVTAGPAQTAD